MTTLTMTARDSYTLGDLAQRLGAELQGDADCEISALATLQEAQLGQLGFLANPAYRKYLAATQASAVILHPDTAADYDGNKLLLDNPYLGYARLSPLFDRQPAISQGVHASAVIDASASIHPTAAIGPQVVVEAGAEIGADVQIGAGCVIGADTIVGKGSRLNANVTVYHGVTIGEHAIVHSGVVIGADGFGFAPGREGWTKIHQLGGVVIGNNVELGAGTTVDRGALGDTRLGHGVKLDNQVQIAHNVQIGDNTAMAACTAVAGSTVIGANCTIAGAVGIVGHLTIVDGVHISAMTLVTKSINQAGSYSSGTPMQATNVWRKNAVRYGQLDQLAVRVRKLEKKSAD